MWSCMVRCNIFLFSPTYTGQIENWLRTTLSSTPSIARSAERGRTAGRGERPGEGGTPGAEAERAGKSTNNAGATIPLAVSSVQTSLTVTSGQGARFPSLGASDFFYATLVDVSGNYEIIKVTARADDAMTLERGQDGTLAIPFPANSRMELRVTVGSIDINNQDVLLL